MITVVLSVLVDFRDFRSLDIHALCSNDIAVSHTRYACSLYNIVGRKYIDPFLRLSRPCLIAFPVVSASMSGWTE